jgi:hypothetical protein
MMDERRQKLFDAGVKLAAHVKLTTGMIIPEDEFNGILDKADTFLDKKADLNDEAGIFQAITAASINIMEEPMDKKSTQNFDQRIAIFNAITDKNAAMTDLINALADNPAGLMAEAFVKIATQQELLVKLAESVEQLTAMVADTASVTGDDIKPEGSAVTETTNDEIEKVIAEAKPVGSLLTGAGDTTPTNHDMAGNGGVAPNAKPTLADTLASAKRVNGIIASALAKKPATK